VGIDVNSTPLVETVSTAFVCAQTGLTHSKQKAIKTNKFKRKELRRLNSVIISGCLLA
jgi:hypothetical protein